MKHISANIAGVPIINANSSIFTSSYVTKHGVFSNCCVAVSVRIAYHSFNSKGGVICTIYRFRILVPPSVVLRNKISCCCKSGKTS